MIDCQHLVTKNGQLQMFPSNLNRYPTDLTSYINDKFKMPFAGTDAVFNTSDVH